MSFSLHVIEWPRFGIESSCENGLFWPLKLEKIEKINKKVAGWFQDSNPGTLVCQSSVLPLSYEVWLLEIML